MCSWIRMHMHSSKHMHVHTHERRGQKLMLVSSSAADRVSHWARSPPIWLDWLFIEPQGSSRPCLPSAGITNVCSFTWLFFLPFKKHECQYLHSSLRAFMASILLIVTSLFWFLPVLINPACSCYDFCLCWLILPVPCSDFCLPQIHFVCSWTSYKRNQTVCTFNLTSLFTSFYHKFMSWLVSPGCDFLLASDNPLYKWIPICLSSCVQTNIWVAFSSGLLWMETPGTFLHKSSCRSMFSSFMSPQVRTELLDHR